MSENRDKNNPRESENGSLLGDAIKKVFAVGLGAAFMTEEGVRSYLNDLKLPKEVLNLLLQGANRSKEELVQRVSKEAIQLLKKIDLVKEFSKFAEEHRFKITAEIEIIPKSKSPGASKSESEGSVTVVSKESTSESHHDSE